MADFSKILIANRGEIAVRVIRAARDEGLATVAVHADPDRDAEHVREADESCSLGGATAAESYLVVAKLLAAAREHGADAVHPGYGFLSESAEFAQAVIDAGLVWIGPPPAAIRLLGDKVSARGIAQEVGAPLVPGTERPVGGAGEVQAFAQEHGLPIAIKAAHGGGGRGIKVVRRHEDVVELYESAVREATAAFGRGECFVERFLDAPRHVETQCLADAHGDVVVVSTRDCSLQRRNQKLVEEAPAPFLDAEQEAQLYRASKAILRRAGYVGAGTCEFLVGADGTLSFLEVNTRLQVEHPVSEEVTGIDLVREQFRIARGEHLGYDDPVVHGHSLEFRINCEDPGRGFMPSPGTLDVFRVPLGPGVRVDAGVRAGETISGAFDSLLAKLVVTGSTRAQALQRARRALADMRIEGVATVLPFHRLVLEDPAFAPELAAAHRLDPDPAPPFSVHTRWIETEFEGVIPPSSPVPAAAADDEAADGTSEGIVSAELHGRQVRVDLPAALSAAVSLGDGVSSSSRGSSSAVRRPREQDPESVLAPMQGTVVAVEVADGAEVVAGETLVVLEAMKMEQPITAHRSGTVRGLDTAAGELLSAGTLVARIVDV
jgi:acetyl-CoA/propionyl-CoA carboxylase biotin carboxyl carrier protein